MDAAPRPNPRCFLLPLGYILLGWGLKESQLLEQKPLTRDTGLLVRQQCVPNVNVLVLGTLASCKGIEITLD